MNKVSLNLDQRCNDNMITTTGIMVSLFLSIKARFALNLTRLLNNNVDEQTICHSISRGITTVCTDDQRRRGLIELASNI